MLATVLTKTVRDRWKAVAIGTATLALFFVFGMAVYRDIDLSLYTDLPEAWRALANIGAEADVGSLAYGAIYSSYGALTLAALALSMGTATIAREEKNGTIGLLLGNPKSRTSVLASKAGSLLLVTAAGTGVLWLAGIALPSLLDVDITGLDVTALLIHMYVNAVFYGFLAMAFGAWTGSTGLASGTTAGIMVLSFILSGLLPLVEGLENAAKAFPWYYYSGGNPLLNGLVWGHLAVLLGGIVLFGALAVVGVNRRDLKGQTIGVTLLDRLRANRMTQRIVDRLAGSTRVSRIWIKTATEHQVLLIIVSYIMFLVMGVMLGPMYNAIDETLQDFADAFPEALLALVGTGDIGTPEGWYQIETFGLMAPIALMVVTVSIGARALAGEEANRTMGLLLANPIPRSRVVLEKTATMVIYAAIVGFMTFGGVALGSIIAGLGMSIVNIAATSVLVTLIGILFGGLALALSAGTGRVRLAIFVTIGVALAFHLWNAFLPLNDSVAGYARWSPFYYYLSSDPLLNGMPWGHAAVLAVLAAGLIGLSVVLFQRRDVRQSG